VVSTIPPHPTGLSHEDTRTTLLQLTRAVGFQGRVAVTSHNKPDTEDLLASGADFALEPFQDAADRAVELLCGGEEMERTAIPEIDADQKTGA
ncbi:MAG: hypothetical protein WDZ54_02150, partial [Sneathiella sp.]